MSGMTITNKGDKTTLKVPEVCTEETVTKFKDALRKSIHSKKNKYSDKDVVLDMSDIEEIDTFGYQTIALFVKHVMSTCKPKSVITKNRSVQIIEFESLMGMSINE